jgi:molybdopterin/thiamine biosynthesis adenylyltransferase
MSCIWIFTHNIYIGIVNIWSMEPEIAGSRMHRISKLINGAQEEFKKLKILIVGVGGIGCEILKVLSKAPIGQIHILDMDTIEVLMLSSRSPT